MAYDSVRDVTVLFGGGRISTDGLSVAVFGDLWEWNGSVWRQRAGSTPTDGWSGSTQTGWRPTYSDRPVARVQHRLSYDTERQRAVLFGGQTRTPDGAQMFLNDLWEWDGTRWFFRATNGPSPRIDHAMAFDRDRGVTVVFGGFLSGPDSTPGALWEWNGEAWRGVAPEDGPSRSHSQDAGGMVYDTGRRTMIFGPSVGDGRWDFWSWNGQAWSKLNIANDAAFLRLAGTQYGSMAFDTERGHGVWFGGSGGAAQNTTAFFDGPTWTLLSNSLAAPPARTRAAMAYDAGRRTIVLFGGAPGERAFAGDTWELQSMTSPTINQSPASQYRALGETVTFKVLATGAGVLTYQWYRGETALSDRSNPTGQSASIRGARTARLTIAGATRGEVGEYRVKVSNRCGEAWSVAAQFTLKPELQIFSSRAGLNLFWADPVLLLEVADNVAGPWKRVPGATSPFNPALVGTARYFRVRPAP
jgi:hypothetical protein